MFYPGMITQRRCSKWDLSNWMCAVTFSNFLKVILAPNFHSLGQKLWVQPLVLTNFDFFASFEGEARSESWGNWDIWFFFSLILMVKQFWRSFAFEVLLQCLSESIQPIETEIVPVENTGLIPVMHQLNSPFIIGTWKNQTSNTLWTNCISWNVLLDDLEEQHVLVIGFLV